ncbi:MAG: isoprenylcysteine carboxylmethyltransferase family protein [Roseivirga sp.]|nr:isoprenylcysteine carboxylmethyltransferase family protein [Roseivirga sp.]
MEELYRLIAAVLFLTMALIGFNFRFKAKKAGDNTTWNEEGSFIMITLRLFGFGTWLVVIMDIVNPEFFGWSSIELSFGLHILGAVILAISLLLIHSLFRAIGKNITDTVGIKEGHELVQSGPYRYIRHPLYTASIMIFTGYGLLLSNWLIPVLGSLTFALLLVRLPKEEENLINHFGEAYKVYMKMTPRFFPKLRQLISF